MSRPKITSLTNFYVLSTAKSLKPLLTIKTLHRTVVNIFLVKSNPTQLLITLIQGQLKIDSLTSWKTWFLYFLLHSDGPKKARFEIPIISYPTVFLIFGTQQLLLHMSLSYHPNYRWLESPHHQHWLIPWHQQSELQGP